MKTPQYRPEIITAYAWASGLIEFTSSRRPKVPKGALIIITGPKTRVKRILCGRARHSHGKRPQLLVPGLPEYGLFPTGKDKLETFTEWRDWAFKNETTKPNRPLILA
jgi:hypothetical protein